MKVGVAGIEEAAAAGILLNLRIRWPDLELVHLENVVRDLSLVSRDTLDVILVGDATEPILNQVQKIRAIRDDVIIALSSHPSDEELVAVLDGGGDDYLPVTATAPQIVARISAALRRERTPEAAVEWVQYDELRANPDRFEVFLGERRLHLTPTEFLLLYHLIRNGGRVITHGALLDLVWGSEGSFYRGSLRKYVHRLRAKLESNTSSSLRIMTEARIGYRLEATAAFSTRRVA